MGEAAFPHGPLGSSWTAEDGMTYHQENPSAGMTLADYFAGQWLIGAISAGVYSNETLGRNAYEAADSLLRERDRRRANAT